MNAAGSSRACPRVCVSERAGHPASCDWLRLHNRKRLRIALCTGGQQLSRSVRAQTGRRTKHDRQTGSAELRANGRRGLSDRRRQGEPGCDVRAGGRIVPHRRDGGSAEAPAAGRALLESDVSAVPGRQRPPCRRMLADCRISVRAFRSPSSSSRAASRARSRALLSSMAIAGCTSTIPPTSKAPATISGGPTTAAEIHAEGFEVVFLLKRGTTYVLAVDWAGAEGNALSVHTAEGGGQFKEIISDSWYRSPM